MKLKSTFSILLASCFLFTSLSIYAAPKCGLGDTCALERGSLKIDITEDDGATFQCIVTTDTAGTLNFSVNGGGKFKVTDGAGAHTAHPTVTVHLVGVWKIKKPVSKGFIHFYKIKGTPGTVVCSAV